MRYLRHITGISTWRDGDGPVAPASLRSEGFVHASPDDATVLAVANAVYADAAEPQLVLIVDTELLDAEVRWEAAEPAPPPGVADDARFPHIYGPVPRAAVAGVRYLRRDPGGVFVSVEERGSTAELLDLLPHPEGGWYRQTWTAGAAVRPEGYPGERSTATGIHFLLNPGEYSRWHRVRSDEMWVFNRGGPLELALGGVGERPEEEARLILGPDLEDGRRLQGLVPAGTWQAARPLTAREVLVSCFVSPGFDFADFEAVD
ncbi:cupin domain-containing protein [Streptomonospora salina]|uniref:Putative cupin superfamily sugar epimerase n=1 Tax=Streptomonospora salina TaxID=104205 RepID=A0A841EK16_9ACTN|nr:cupin domain-containing protein [Streptomonospora salina]MBB6001118.1 putative cupin superfamily sugar epimerase [Streptomonospora salina]